MSQPHLDLEQMLEMIGEAGLRMSEINAAEGAAGNLSIYFHWPVDPARLFPVEEPLPLPTPAPHLAGGWLLVTGSGRRLRQLARRTVTQLGLVQVHPDGRTATLFTAPSREFARLSGEFNSHLAIHEDQAARSSVNFQAILHAQPRHITFLSHIERYRAEAYLNQQLVRWQPEFVVHLPEGVAVVPFAVPSSTALEQATVQALRARSVVIWCKHGIVARSDVSINHAADRVEYVEAAAQYEVFNLANQQAADGLSPSEVQAIATAFGVNNRRG